MAFSPMMEENALSFDPENAVTALLFMLTLFH